MLVAPRLSHAITRCLITLNALNPFKQALRQTFAVGLLKQVRWAKSITTACHWLAGTVSDTAIADAPVSAENDNPANPVYPFVDAALVERLRAGDNGAWDEFVDTYSPKLFALLRYKLPTAQDAEDVLNETFGAAVRAIQKFDGRASLMTWLAAIARNKIANYYQAMPQPHEPEEMAENMPAPVLSFSLEFREALDVVPAHIRQVLLLRYRQGFSVGEIAELTGRTYKSVESLLSRGRALLAALLAADKGLDASVNTNAMTETQMDSNDEYRLQARFNELGLDDRLTPSARARVRQTVRRAWVQARLDALNPRPVVAQRPGFWSRLFTSPSLALGAFALLAVGLIALAYGVAQWQPPPGAAVSLTNGAATITRANTREQVTLAGTESATLRPGDQISVARGLVLITYGRDLSTQLQAGAAAQLNDYASSGVTITVDLAILQGHSESRVDRPLNGADRFVVRSLSSEAAVRGTLFIVETRSQTMAYYATNRGLVQVRMGEQQADVPQGYEVEAVVGQKLDVRKQGPPPTPTPSPTPLPTSTPSPTPTATPTATPTPTQTPTPTPTIHIVRPGETLFGIAARYGVSAEAIMAANPSVRRSPRILRVGEQIVIPGK